MGRQLKWFIVRSIYLYTCVCISQVICFNICWFGGNCTRDKLCIPSARLIDDEIFLSEKYLCAKILIKLNRKNRILFQKSIVVTNRCVIKAFLFNKNTNHENN